MKSRFRRAISYFLIIRVKFCPQTGERGVKFAGNRPHAEHKNYVYVFKFYTDRGRSTGLYSKRKRATVFISPTFFIWSYNQPWKYFFHVGSTPVTLLLFCDDGEFTAFLFVDFVAGVSDDKIGEHISVVGVGEHVAVGLLGDGLVERQSQESINWRLDMLH